MKKHPLCFFLENQNQKIRVTAASTTRGKRKKVVQKKSMGKKPVDVETIETITKSVETKSVETKHMDKRSNAWDHFTAFTDKDTGRRKAKCNYCETGDGFITFMAAAQPLFQIPSRWSISRDCYQLFLDEKKKLQSWFKSSGQSISITTDTWTSLQRINYMCITAHYVDSDWKLNKKIINFCSIDSHRGEELGRAIDGCLREWGIARVFSITVDNASSNDTCVVYLKAKFTARGCVLAKGKYLHMRCIAHIINLIVVDGLKEINPSIKRVREAVRWVRQSPSRLGRFRECCEDEGIGSKRLLCLDVSTRWNSTYLMLDVAQTFERAFDRYDLKDPYFKDELSDGVPTIEDWENVRRMVDILSIFYDRWKSS